MINKIVSPKITSLTFGILSVVFLAAFYVIAWQEPTQAPPGGNVPIPINVGTEPQAKAGRFSATEFYDYNDPNYYLNPSGQSVLSTLCMGANCRSSWPTEIPSGMIAMFDMSCPLGWTRFVALDGRFPQGSVTYGGTGGASSHSHSVSGTTGDGSNAIGGIYGQSGGVIFSTPPHTHSFSANSGSADNLPPYLNVIWCKKN